MDHPRYLLRLAELELIDRERRLVERRIREARFPAVKSLDTFDFTAMPTLNKPLVLELARCEFVVARDNIIVLATAAPGRPILPWPWVLLPVSGASRLPSLPPPASSISSKKRATSAACSTAAEPRRRKAADRR